MAKAKVKNIPFDNKATEISAGRWEWECDGVKWFWKDWKDWNSLNCGVIVDGADQSAAYFKTIKEAGIFSEGVRTGRHMVELSE